MRPACVQLELTYSCNNACTFCYNHIASAVTTSHVSELLAEEWECVIADLADYGVFSVNFNGGEPLAYKDFFRLAEFAVAKGMDVHLNTNGTLISKHNVELLSRVFKAVCISLHGATPSVHDVIVGRNGAFEEALNGFRMMRNHGVYVAVNVVLSRLNLTLFPSILAFLRKQGVQTVLLTRVLTRNLDLAITNVEFMRAVSYLRDFELRNGAYERVAFPQPIRLCECTDAGLRTYISEHNIACAAGLMVVRISPLGLVTPCPLMDDPVFGNVKDKPFSEIWEPIERTGWSKRFPFLDCCEHCVSLSQCGGGCIPQNDGVLM